MTQNSDCGTEDIKGVLDASTQISNNLKRVCKNYEFFKNRINSVGDRGSLHVEIQLPRVFHRASKSGSTHEPWGVYGTDLMV